MIKSWVLRKACKYARTQHLASQCRDARRQNGRETAADMSGQAEIDPQGAPDATETGSGSVSEAEAHSEEDAHSEAGGQNGEVGFAATT